MFKYVTCIVFMFSLLCNAEGEMKFTGMPSVAMNSENTFVNFGGPNFKVEYNEYSLSLSFYPSVRFNKSMEEWSPILGAGASIGKNNLFLVLPNYYYDSKWHNAVGLGYKF